MVNAYITEFILKAKHKIHWDFEMQMDCSISVKGLKPIVNKEVPVV